MMALKAKIIGHETQVNNKIVYVVQVHNDATQKSKISKLRYSEFRQIHQQLQGLIIKLKLHIILPQFPGKKVFGKTNKSEESIQNRKRDLSNYLNDLLVLDKLYGLDVIKKHFIPDEKQLIEKNNNDINMQICIDRYTLVEDVVIYYVRLRDLNSHEEWTFKSRYSQLRDVHEALIESKIKNLPTFPKKKLFGITNESPENIQIRREQLQKYFNQIFSVRQILSSDALKYFIEESKKLAQRDKELQAMRRKKKEKVQDTH